MAACQFFEQIRVGVRRVDDREVKPRWSAAATTRSVLFVVVLYALTGGLVYLFFTDQRTAVTDWSDMRLLALLFFLPTVFRYYIGLVTAPLFDALMWWRRRRSRHARRGFEPSVSVVIPAWNEEVGVVTTIRSILESNYRNLEVIVINDGSTDNTDAAVQRYLGERRTTGLPTPVHYYRQDNAGKSAALNRGVNEAAGDIIVTIDADSLVDPDAIGNLVKHFENESVMAVAGNIRIGNRARVIGLVQQLEYLFGFYFKRADSLLNSIYVVGGAAAAYRREAFTELGGFDGDIIAEDLEMSVRIQDAGYANAYAPDAIVYTEGPIRLNDLLKQRLRWKFGKLHTFAKYSHLFMSTDRRHSWPLTLLMLPIAVAGEALFLLEIPLLALFHHYMVTEGDYVPLLVNVGIASLVILWQIVADPKRRDNLNLLILAPVAWLVFYIADAVEIQALVRSLWRIARKRDVTWQRWSRTGVFEQAGLPGTSEKTPH